MRWITASRLEEWARLPASRGDLPAIVGDLIRASCPDISAFRFPSGDKGQVRGFDGHLETTWGGNNVPEGNSYWEFGTEQTYKRKASQEFERCSNLVPEDVRKDSTFVFVSPWTWNSSNAADKIEDWEEQRSKEFAWKAIHCIGWRQIGGVAAKLPRGIGVARAQHPEISACKRRSD